MRTHANNIKGCSPAKWVRTAKYVAAQHDGDHVKVLAGCRQAPYLGVRWAAWRMLAADGFSYASIGSASGFDHTSIIHACDPAMRERRRARDLARAAKDVA